MLVGVTVAGMAQGDPGRWADIAGLTALFMAVMGMFAWLLRLSSLVNFLSETILLGFKAGGEHFFERLVARGSQIPDAILAVLVFGLAALAMLLVGERLLRGQPVALFVVVISIIVLSVTSLRDLGVNITHGKIRLPSSLSFPKEGTAPSLWLAFISTQPHNLDYPDRNDCWSPHVIE